MLEIKITTLFLILIMTSCLARIDIQSSAFDKESSQLVDATVNILTTCYLDRGDAIVVSGNVPKNFLSTVSLKTLVPIASLSVRENVTDYYVSVVGFYPLKLFVIGASSYEEFEVNLSRIESSNWWNTTGSFIILCEWPQNCPFEKNILLHAFRRGVINPKIIRLDSERKVIIVTGNPYIYEGPDPWRMISSFKPNNHTFYVYSRKYEEDIQMCNNLDFVSTKNLGGYDIRAVARVSDGDQTVIVTNLNFDTNDRRFYYLAIFQHYLNGTIKMFYRDKKYERFTGPKEAFSLAELYRIRYDVYVQPVDCSGKYAAALLYPHEFGSTYIMTKFSGHKSQLEKLLSVIDLNSRIAVCLVLLITWFFFKFVAHQKVVPAVLNVVRITCNTGFENIPEEPAARLYLSSVLFFALTLHGIYEGLLASLLQNTVPYPDINNLEELIDSNLTIYGFEKFDRLFVNTKAAKRFVPLSISDCGEYVAYFSQTACVNYEFPAVYHSTVHNLHISREPVMSLYFAFPCNKNNPFCPRLSKLILILQAAGIHKPFTYPRKQKIPADFIFDKVVMSNVGIKVMTLEELAFAFEILGGGLTFAALIFIVELAIKLFRSRIRTVKVQVLK